MNLKEALPLSPEEATALIINSNITKKVYIEQRNIALSHNHDLYPKYSEILKAKEKTYPNNISVKELTMEVPLQDLLHHTADRLIAHLKLSPPKTVGEILPLELKYGFDGTSSNSYKQRWNGEQGNAYNLFCSSLVSLQFVHQETKKVLWINPIPSSARLCRPIRYNLPKKPMN
ncbi:hypothetical protein TSAR_001557 [Trichomalopsis sarcophagae]|uniref:Uncharacterized protein n=1 Tax=Trichomalopsis sarcophagae TaxID=543379 RepID=A0A232F2V8_9HYME|nr:hypothetical protein TSAR_001557 [Trichomalopsis sarcophagae]